MQRLTNYHVYHQTQPKARPYDNISKKSAVVHAVTLNRETGEVTYNYTEIRRAARAYGIDYARLADYAFESVCDTLTGDALAQSWQETT